MNVSGKPVVDANKPILLVITKNDIKKGSVKNAADCAAAIACRRQLHAADARVNLSRTLVLINGKWRRFMTPKPLKYEIVAFDRGGRFEPGEYLLKPFPEHSRLGMRHEQGNRGPRDPNAAMMPPRHVVAGVRERAAKK